MCTTKTRGAKARWGGSAARSWRPAALMCGQRGPSARRATVESPRGLVARACSYKKGERGGGVGRSSPIRFRCACARARVCLSVKRGWRWPVDVVESMWDEVVVVVVGCGVLSLVRARADGGRGGPFLLLLPPVGGGNSSLARRAATTVPPAPAEGTQGRNQPNKKIVTACIYVFFLMIVLLVLLKRQSAENASGRRKQTKTNK